MAPTADSAQYWKQKSPVTCLIPSSCLLAAWHISHCSPRLREDGKLDIIAPFSKFDSEHIQYTLTIPPPLLRMITLPAVYRRLTSKQSWAFVMNASCLPWCIKRPHNVVSLFSLNMKNVGVGGVEKQCVGSYFIDPAFTTATTETMPSYLLLVWYHSAVEYFVTWNKS